MADLKLNDSLQVGDEVLTDLSSTAVLRLPDGSTVKVFPGSRVVFEDPGGTLKNFLHIIFGTVKLQIEKLAGRPNPKAVTTPTAIVAVRGTVFQVAVEQDDTTGVEVEEGEVSVANRFLAGSEVLLKGGEESRVQRGMPPLPPQPRGTGPGPSNRRRPEGNSTGPGGAAGRPEGDAQQRPSPPPGSVSNDPGRQPMPRQQTKPQLGQPAPKGPSQPQAAPKTKR